ncbi:MAG: TonB-dependent receptor [Chitinophagaceae bacterium]|nr:MAG: TonB-dependent receptor [Chitinophagaceae bacterium]
MKKIILMIFMVMSFIHNVHAKNTLTGKITAQKNGAPLSNVNIYFPDLKIGGTTNVNGMYKIDNLPSTILLVQVSIVGYKVITENIDLSKTNHKDFIMEEAITELNEIVITGLSKSTERKKAPMPITVMSATQLKQLSASNIIDAVATLPGISQITTGAGISKPVIRGLGYNRVVVVNNGIRQEGQQWGDEHGIEIDEFSIHRIEVLKGPASLAYGSDAIAGVINFLTQPNMPKDKRKANLLLNYQTNNGLLAGSFDIAGNKNDINWDLRFSKKAAHAYQNKYDGHVFNSGFQENSLSGTIGINKFWGYSHLNASIFQSKPGMIEGERDDATGKFLKPYILNDIIEEKIADKNDFKSYKLYTPYQRINHYKIVSSNNIILKNGTIKTILGWQQNHRKEFDDLMHFNDYGLYFLMNTFNYDIRYSIPEFKDISLSFGANGMYQHSKNKGTEFLIPDYRLFDIGAFMIAKKTWNKINLTGGLRFDNRRETTQNLWINDIDEQTNLSNNHLLFSAFEKNFNGFTGSIGATYQISNHFYTKLNFAKGFRAPNIAELASNGVHEGTLNYIKGSTQLKAENSQQLDYTFGINSLHVSAETNLFYNHIKNYIFLQKMQLLDGSDLITDGYPTFQYTSGNAHLYGGELSIDIHPHPLDWLHFENSFSYVYAFQKNQPDSLKYLPMIPAAKIVSELKMDKPKIGKYLKNNFLKISVENHFSQKHVHLAFNTETATPGYSLINLGLGTDISHHSKTICSLILNFNNLTNKSYQNHLSRLKYAPENLVTGRKGVFNMGRNISIKMLIPLDI